MSEPIEWVKKVVRASYGIYETEQEKQEYYLEMEEEYLRFSEKERENIRNIMLEQFEVNDMMFVFSNILCYMKVKDFQEDAMKNILRGNFDAYTGSLLKYQSLFHVRGEYERKRLLNKRNMMGYDEMLNVNYSYIPIERRNKKRIVIVTGQILNTRHSPTLALLNMAYALQERLGYEVLFFICPCDGRLSQELWYKQVIEVKIEHWRNNPVKVEFRGVNFYGYQISMEPYNLKEFSMMLALIHAWNPIFVLNADTTNSVVELVNKFTTLVALTMSIECPISEGEILIRLGKMDNDTEQKYAKVIEDYQKQLFMKEKFPIITEENTGILTRIELGLPESKFLIAIVGNRLKMDIDNEFVQVMKSILEKVQNIAFVIIGVFDEEEWFADEIFREHIYYLGYCSDLIGVYKVLDLYLNPKRAGGGYSGGMALQAELPVITLPDCDVAYNCGSNFVVQNYEEMIETVYRYVNDQDFYYQKKVQVQKYNDEDRDNGLVRFVEELLEGINRLMK